MVFSFPMFFSRISLMNIISLTVPSPSPSKNQNTALARNPSFLLQGAAQEANNAVS